MVPPKTAVCLIGYPRTFLNYHVWSNILEDASTYTRNGDIFIVFQNDNRDSIKGQKESVDSNILYKTIENFNPIHVAFTFEKPQTFNCPRIFISPTDQWKKMDTCVSLISSFENKHNFRYEWLIKMRPDVVNRKKLSLNWYEELKLDTIYKSENSNDIRMYIPRNFWNNISKAYKSINCKNHPSLFAGYSTSHLNSMCECTIIRTKSAKTVLDNYDINTVAWSMIQNRSIYTYRKNVQQRLNKVKRGYGLTVQEWINEKSHV